MPARVTVVEGYFSEDIVNAAMVDEQLQEMAKCVDEYSVFARVGPGR